uniref:Uncharacterized protein n=1 Tax=Avena sativa TaxID=4498 RepID=A0ACD5ULD7_AVESA
MLRRRSSSHTSPAQLAPLEDENLLWEILLRLPPLPSSLPSASILCKRWLSIVSDPGFIRSFRGNHRNPPLLGLFVATNHGADFIPTLDPPDRIPAARFSPPPQSISKQSWSFLGCRHGLCLFIDDVRPDDAIVYDPITSHQRRIPLPSELVGSKDSFVLQNGGVVCVAGHGRVHGDCSLSPFKLVLLYSYVNDSSVSACLYESQSGVWGNVVSKTMAGEFGCITPSVLVRNALCWLSQEGSILEFDMENQSLSVTEMPANHQNTDWSCYQLLRTEENRLGLVVLTGSVVEILVRKVNYDGTALLVLQKTVELHKLLPLGLSMNILPHTCRLQGFDEEDNAIFLSLGIGVFMVNLETLQVTNISARLSNTYYSRYYYPYRSFYTAAVGDHGTGRGASEDYQCQAAGAAGGGRT